MTIEAEPLAGKIDVVGSKLMKLFEFLQQQLIKHDFKILKSAWEWGKNSNSFFYFLLDKKPLPKTIEVEGPPVKMNQHAENFRKMHKKTFEKSGKVHAVDERKYTIPETLLNQLINSQYAKERSKSVKLKIQ